MNGLLVLLCVAVVFLIFAILTYCVCVVAGESDRLDENLREISSEVRELATQEISKNEEVKEGDDNDFAGFEYDIRLNSANDAALFVAVCDKYDCDIDYMYNSHYILDAQSLISVIGAGLGKICRVVIRTDTNSIRAKFKKDIAMWRVD